MVQPASRPAGMARAVYGRPGRVTCRTVAPSGAVWLCGAAAKWRPLINLSHSKSICMRSVRCDAADAVLDRRAAGGSTSPRPGASSASLKSDALRCCFHYIAASSIIGSKDPPPGLLFCVTLIMNYCAILLAFLNIFLFIYFAAAVALFV